MIYSRWFYNVQHVLNAWGPAAKPLHLQFRAIWSHQTFLTSFTSSIDKLWSYPRLFPAAEAVGQELLALKVLHTRTWGRWWTTGNYSKQQKLESNPLLNSPFRGDWNSTLWSLTTYHLSIPWQFPSLLNFCWNDYEYNLCGNFLVTYETSEAHNCLFRESDWDSDSKSFSARPSWTVYFLACPIKRLQAIDLTGDYISRSSLQLLYFVLDRQFEQYMYFITTFPYCRKERVP